jgi:3-oxoacyl-[acyl-carrier protein] reductase
MFEVRHRRAIITGAASGIGLASARLLAQAGVSIVGLDIAPPPPGGAGPTFPMLRVDITDEQQVIDGVAEAARQLGGVDLLINSAGIEIESPLAQIRAADIDRMYAVNVRGLILVTREALPHLQATRPNAATGAFGFQLPAAAADAFHPQQSAAAADVFRIINVASELAYLGRAGASGYCGTKAAVLGLTRSWARELAPQGLVNAVAPGPIDTPLLHFADMTPEQQAQEQANPLGRIGRADEVAAVIGFLASSSASFITGQCYGADGGAAMR